MTRAVLEPYAACPDSRENLHPADSQQTTLLHTIEQMEQSDPLTDWNSPDTWRLMAARNPHTRFTVEQRWNAAVLNQPAQPAASRPEPNFTAVPRIAQLAPPDSAPYDATTGALTVYHAPQVPDTVSVTTVATPTAAAAPSVPVSITPVEADHREDTPAPQRPQQQPVQRTLPIPC